MEPREPEASNNLQVSKEIPTNRIESNPVSIEQEIQPEKVIPEKSYSTEKPFLQQGQSISEDIVSKDIEAAIIQVQEKHKKIWEPVTSNPERKKLEENYYSICPENLVFFDVKDQNLFIEQTRLNYEMLSQKHKGELIKRWDEKEMDRMFGKGLNPTSLITSLESAKWFSENLPKDDNPVVLELGPGAGWSTVMLFDTLKEKDLKAKIVSIDHSLHAIAAAKTLLEYKGIPSIIAGSLEEMVSVLDWMENTKEGKDFEGVVLALGNFNEAVRSFPSESIDGIYSSHGTAYISKEEYTELFRDAQKTLKKDGLFIADSLNPLYTNRLSTGLTIAQMLFPDMVKNILTKKNIDYIENKKTILKSNSKYFQDQKVTILKGFNTEHAYLIFRWCNYLIRTFQIGRFLDTKKSLEVTMDVVEAYRDDVYPSHLLKDIVSNNNLSYEELGQKPEFPIFMDTQGFRLKK